MEPFDSHSKMGVVFSSSGVENLEAAVMTLLEVTSGMDWWTYAVKSLALYDKSNTAKVNCFFAAGARCQLLLAKSASTF